MERVSTNIRLPRDMLIELKIRAAKERKSVAELMRRAVEDTYGIRSGAAAAERYQEVIEKVTKRLIKEYRPEKIVLFGSVAEGNIQEGSDIDMLIIKDTKAKTLADRWEEILPLVRDLKGTIPFEPLIYTPREVEERLAAHDLFLKSILETGKVLYDRQA